MKKLCPVTFTGADDAVDPNDLAAISREYPFVEWGILLSKSNAGRPRYPSRDWIQQAEKIFRSQSLQASGHICGSWMRDLCGGDFSVLNECP